MSRFLTANAMRTLLPALSLAALLAAIFYLQPRTMSYFGLNLLLNLAVPIALATIAQMFILCVNDLDLSLGAFVSLTACITATWLYDTPVLGVLALAGCVLAYALLGALIHLRNLPSIVVTLGMSFVWMGIAVLILPTPGGKAPEWIRTLMTLKPAYVPFPIIASVVLGLVVHFGLMRSAAGVVLRGAGGNPQSVERAGWSLLKVKVSMFALAGFFGVLSGMALVGLTTSADANIALRYTLLSIAGVILGGGEFVGGRVSPIGAVIGAITLALAGSFLSFLRLNPDWQIGAQGAILILVLALRVLIDRSDRRS
uniref:ABC transporter permease n=1 Tax=Pararhizobium sp. IMCC3301 TaxID=3067904 RepID=UPI002740CD33|nr:ABC transporter permease [Pararhizobium sp. IMCC3301]